MTEFSRLYSKLYVGCRRLKVYPAVPASSKSNFPQLKQIDNDNANIAESDCYLPGLSCETVSGLVFWQMIHPLLGVYMCRHNKWKEVKKAAFST